MIFKQAAAPLLTLAQVKAAFPTNKEPETWLALLNEVLPKYNITTPERIAGFLAQAGHESADLVRLIENLNYSAEGLRKTFPRYFLTDVIALGYARQPERIANRVYADENRVSKLGNVNPGDGWRFRGRGIFQLTGRNNYSAFGKSIGMTADQAATYCETKKGALESACWFWTTRKLAAFADKGDIDGMSKAVNGGTNGLADRKKRYTKIIKLLKP